MRHRGARLSLLSALVAGVVAPVTGSVGVAAAAATPGVAPAGPTVTLLTGDKVTIGGMRGVTVRAAKGREHVSFFTRTDVDGDTHVIPEDALVPLSKGKLDPRLFDVTELARIGYDDASRERLPVIVDYPGGTPRMAGAQVSRELPAMSAAAVSVDRTPDFWTTAQNAEHIWLDGPVKASLDHSVPQIGAPDAWAAGHTGAGTTVAVLDTGIDATHPDLSDAIAGAQNFTDSDTDDDRFGHGTHVASIITGSGAKSGGEYRGVAPDAKLLNGKVLNDFGSGAESWVIAGMEWAAASGADVVNMSLGTQWSSDGTDPMSQAVNRITAETGTLFVIAAGNTGEGVGSPGAADAALTVGAVDREDRLASFSSRGREDGAIKPEVTAPGVNIVAAKAANGFMGKPVADGYVSESGTSMATPHVAGAAAILAGEHPDWTAEALKSTLMGSAEPNDEVSVLAQGAGRVNVAKATTSTVFASEGSLNLGMAQWPHDDDQPIARTVTYHNTGTAPVTLDLAADMTDPNGSASPQGMFTVAPARLTVPAGGQATATVTADTTVDATDGVHGGVVTATGGGQSVHTPLTVNREVESYDVSLRFIDLNGALTDLYAYSFTDMDSPRYVTEYDASGSVVARVPKGEFYLQVWVQTQTGPHNYKTTEFIEPSVTITGDTSFVLDARDGKPVSFTVDKPNARIGTALYQFVRKAAWGDIANGVILWNYDDVVFRPSTTAKKDQFSFIAEARLAEWNGQSFEGSPYTYNVRHTENGTVPRNLQWTFHDRDLAKVRGEYASTTPGAVGVRDGFLTMPLPTTLTEYYSPDVPWDGQFMEVSDPSAWPPVSWVEQVDPKTFRLGRTQTVRWNVGVFGTAFPNSERNRFGDWNFAGRRGDVVNFPLPMITDQDPGRMGLPTDEVGTTTLLRDGEVVFESQSPGFLRTTVEPERAEYTLRTSADRSQWARLSTQISAEWTFVSEYVPGDQWVRLPLLAVRFAPNLDNHNAAPAGKRFTIPVYVQSNADTVGRVSTPAVEVSYDDGTTWQPSRVTRDGGCWKATVDHPADAQFVSLRSSITDATGHTARQTIIRAYALK
ncbi:S8 family peptidase [Actinophytocola sp.]|uniref:S8 family peptidase n=1 Tax=Actinophytocola sp. TaxID=1872138 RepID=UPI002ED41713